jgi:hypothetical protein
MILKEDERGKQRYAFDFREISKSKVKLLKQNI